MLLRNNEQVEATTPGRRTHSPQLTLPPPQPSLVPVVQAPLANLQRLFQFPLQFYRNVAGRGGDEPARGSDLGQCCQWMRNHHKNGATEGGAIGRTWAKFFEKKDSRRKCTGGTRSHNLFLEFESVVPVWCTPVRESWLQTSAQAASASLDSLSPRFALPHATMHHRDTPSEQNPNTGMWRPTKTPLGFSGSEEKN